ncbi:urease accessory protein UreD [Komagataeibacter oboediens]|nr:urease accessory protein UreD [Komagataeibacter oboediens]
MARSSFDGSRFHRHMAVDMAGSASSLFLGNRIFGRQGSGEHLSRLGVRDRLSIRRDNELLLEDMLRLDSMDVSALLAQPAVMGGQGAVATLVLVSPQAMDVLARATAAADCPRMRGVCRIRMEWHAGGKGAGPRRAAVGGCGAAYPARAGPWQGRAGRAGV